MRKQEFITPDWDLPEDLHRVWILGAYRGIPILHLPRSGKAALYVADVNAFTTLTRYGDTEFSLKAIDEERARELVNNDPAQAQLAADARAEHVRRWRLRAELRLYESYEFEVHDRAAVAGRPLVTPT